jgi:hypothetical protein
MFFVYYTDLRPGPGAGRRYRIVATLIYILVAILGMVSCVVKMDYMSKVSGTLLQQVELRREQIVSPDAERLKQMQAMGLSTGDLSKQLVFVYVKEPLSTAQAEDLSALGVNVHTDSWIPPVDSHPLGFFIAEIPVDKLEALAARDYIARLDTADRQSLPQCPVTDY